MIAVYDTQLLAYLKLANKRLSLLFNLNVRRLIDGYKRLLNGYYNFCASVSLLLV